MRSLVLAIFIAAASMLSLRAEVDISFDAGSALNGPVRLIAALPDGKILIAGEFSTVRGAVRQRIARLLPNGSADLSFDAGAGPDDRIQAISVLSNGKILVAGDFKTFANHARPYLVRLNIDGTVDESLVFKIHAHFGAGGGVSALQVDLHDRIIIAGLSYDLRGGLISSLARLNSDGSLDDTFALATSDVVPIAHIAVQSDENILVAGGFNFGLNLSPLAARFLPSGAPDPDFHPPGFKGGMINALALQGDKIIVAGQADIGNIVRLNANGSLDNSFTGSASTGPVYAIAMQEDGRVILSGSFAINGVSGYLQRLLVDGARDETFVAPYDPYSYGSTAVALIDGKIVAATRQNTVARFHADGALDETFYSASGGVLSNVILQRDGSLLVAGSFAALQGVSRPGLAKLSSNGRPDLTFSPSSGGASNIVIFSAVRQANGKIVLSGNRDNTNATWRLNPDGTFDGSFSRVTTQFVRKIFALQDGRLLLRASTGDREAIWRLNEDGTIDETFPRALDSYLQAVQPDGKLIATTTTAPNGGPGQQVLGRFLSNGSPDGSFAPINAFPSAVAFQADGKLLTSGSQLQRFLTNGLFDSSFRVWTAPSTIFYLVVQPDQSILASGYGFIARLYSDGTLDRYGIVPADGILSVIPKPNGQLLVWGSFTKIENTARQNLALIAGVDSLAQLRITAQWVAGQLVITSNDPASGFAIQSAPDIGTPFSFFGNTVPFRLDTTWEPQRFFRLGLLD